MLTCISMHQHAQYCMRGMIRESPIAAPGLWSMLHLLVSNKAVFAEVWCALWKRHVMHREAASID